MKVSALITALILSSTTAFAGDADNGLELYQEVEIERTISGEHYTEANCETCHSAEIYQREDRKATTYAKLESRVEGCNTNLDVGWFPEDVSDVAAYLNREYYKFEK
ncbi:hypothetical protein [Neptunomonas japonica]|uniref:Cytochrome c domain-containing protein n=1 Tax=Neptunomonas japonica JAMM 1380 TaxID=1441457 RepID=A0A7R6PHB5_9GAMM|nr:hypothetical protein [Neptunomonas japonica]BBB29618.1 conserved hypothetical protein [Neptunomonas japonica JAMM 1380]